MTQTVIGVFDTPTAAHLAEDRLTSQGIDQSCMHIEANENAYEITDETVRARRSSTGGISGFFSQLFGTGDSDEAGNYSEAVRRGSTVLAVDVPDDASVDRVRSALLDAGAVDIDERVEQWRKQGYSGYNPESKPYTAEEIAQERNTVLPVIQEDIEVGKREVNKGTVRVYSRTVETPVQETVNLREEHATIERRPVDRPASPADLDAVGDKTIEVQEMGEKAVVNKTARVVEEVEVGKEVSQRTETIQDTVRHTEVQVERGAGEERSQDAQFSRSYEDYEADYRNDFQTRYASLGGSYEDYAPAYRYGHTLASDPRYQGRDWSSIETEAERDWGQRNPEGTWERFKLAVRHGWERVTGKR